MISKFIFFIISKLIKVSFIKIITINRIVKGFSSYLTINMIPIIKFFINIENSNIFLKKLIDKKFYLLIQEIIFSIYK